MKCPVCKNAILSQEASCKHCGFNDLHRVFINIKDAQDWEQNVVHPYRMKWELGVSDAEEWLVKIYECRTFYEKEVAEKKATHLTARKSEDLHIQDPQVIQSLHIEYRTNVNEDLASKIANFPNIKVLSMQHLDADEKGGHINSESMDMILKSCPNIVELRLGIFTDCSVLSKLNFRRIEKLSVSLNCQSVQFKITSNYLKSLKISNIEVPQPRKNAKIARDIFDFTGLPALDTLDLTGCIRMDYSSIEKLCNLKNLRISDDRLKDLKWLSKNYQLIKLAVTSGKTSCLDGLECQGRIEHLDLSHNAITSIAGIEKQQCLKYLNLRFNSISTTDELRKLTVLKYLDLMNNPLSDETAVYELGISKTILTRFDKEILEIDSIFTGKTVESIPGYAYMWITNTDKQDLNKVSGFKKTFLQQWKGKTYGEKAKEALQVAFNRKYYEIYKKELYSYKYFDHRHRRIFLKKAMQHYPFLQLTEDMKADLNKTETI